MKSWIVRNYCLDRFSSISSAENWWKLMKFKVSDWKIEVSWFHKNDKKDANTLTQQRLLHCLVGLPAASASPRPSPMMNSFVFLTWCEALSSVLRLDCSEGGPRVAGSYVCKINVYCELRFTESRFWWAPGTCPHEIWCSMRLLTREALEWTASGGPAAPLCIKHCVFGEILWKVQLWAIIVWMIFLSISNAEN